MNAETFAEWMRRQGHQVFRTASSYWYDAGPRVLQAFPYHWLITPDEKEIRELMLGHGIVAVRYSTPLDFPNGMVSYHVVLHKPYELEMLRSQARNGVKRGLDHFKVEQISFERLATEGWVLQQDTLARQDRLRSMTQKEWELLCRSANGLQGFETWAAISQGELAGAVIICRIDNVFNVPYAMSHSRFLANHVNNVIFFCMSREMLGRADVSGIFFTVQSLDAPANVDEFKFRMGFEPKAVRQCVDFHPFLNPFATPVIHSLTRNLLQRDPSNPWLAKATGMLRFHLEGKRDIAEQTWSDCLSTQKDALLHNGLLNVAPPFTPTYSYRGNKEIIMENIAGCQLPNVPKLSEGLVPAESQSFLRRMKRTLAVPWNYYVKRWLKQAYRMYANRFALIRPMKDRNPAQVELSQSVMVIHSDEVAGTQQLVDSLPQLKDVDSMRPGKLAADDWVRVRSREEIQAMLDPFKETRGCAFLEDMYKYCGTKQRVLKSMERFLDERDYQVKKVRGVILLENVICSGTPAFGKCDRCCFLFWREEWLEKIAG